MPELGVRRLVMPIVANRMGRGFFSLLAGYGEEHAGFDDLDRQFVKHGAAVCAVEMAKEKAVREAQKRMQGGVIERLLQGSLPVDQALRHLARLGHQPEGRLYATVAATARGSGLSERRLETTLNEQIRAHGLEGLVQIIDGNVIVFCALDSAGERSSQSTLPRAIRQFAESSLARLRSVERSGLAAIGVGRPVDSLPEWRTSYLEALAALNIAVQWGVEQPLYFANLGVYQLLSLLMQTPELRKFYRETLGGLAEENPVNAEFVATLEMFFEEHGNLSKTAGRLHVHRNTLLYRMERIATITGLNLDHAETRLAVQLALHIRRMMGARSA
jgi:purine catabolism regulator